MHPPALRTAALARSIVLTTVMAGGCFYNPAGSESEPTGSTGESTTTASDASTGATTPTEPTTGGLLDCGDSQIDAGEECDNGELNNGQGGGICKADCTLNTCGDGYVASNEGCDDGNSNDKDDCDNGCQLTGCGDGVPGPGEACDDANMVDDDGCSNLCKLPFCGDGHVGMDEQCDDGPLNANDQACKLDCTAAACGDGDAWLAVEECDDGDQDDTNACTNACKLATCGDMIVSPAIGEQCDLGGMNSDLGACTAICKNAGCGDGLVQAGVEECDDGNMVDDDTCSVACKLAKCGDAIVQAGEDCDDGNLAEDDGCTNTCKQLCGNGTLDPGEDCDDGNDNNDDICNNTCEKVALVVFVTSQKFPGDLGGMAGASEICNSLAAAAGLTGTYKAWLSDFDDNPAQNFAQAMMPWRRLDGMTVASDWMDLITGSLGTPISVTETGMSVGGGNNDCSNPERVVWTNTKPAGILDNEPHCNGWTSAQANDKAGGGVAGSVSAQWTDACQLICNAQARLYCFEQP
ncbi:MAG TPA: DUF4215 domain-containing protein [Nannocystis sp.]|jgi:cysteine-rich repeat protein